MADSDDRVSDPNGDLDIESPPATGENLQDFFSFQEIFRRVLASANEELSRSSSLLFWSGLAAGLSLGLTFLARASFTALNGGTDPGFVGNLLYPIGFILIVIGRYQLFTENTLTPVVLVLTRLASVASLLRLWVVVLIGNLTGAVIMALLLAWSGALSAEATSAGVAFGEHALEAPMGSLLGKSVVAGWVVASMVWLVHSARDTLARIVIVWALMFLIGVADLFHVITGTLEAVFALVEGTSSWSDLPGFFLGVLAGNVVGGVLFVAILNSAQFGREEGGLIAEGLRQSAADGAET